MGARGQSIYFGILACVGAALIFGYAARKPHMQQAGLLTSKCFADPLTRYYNFLPDWMNRTLCAYNGIFRAQLGSPQAKLLANIFGRVQYMSSAIMAYESFRQTGFSGRRGHAWLMLSQITSIGSTLPFYFATSANRKRDVMARRPSTEQTWSVFASLLLGYMVPSAWVTYKSFSYDSLSLWQIYPLFMMALNAVLPSLLRPFLRNSPATWPIYAIATVGMLFSASAHFKLLGSGVDFRDVLQLFSQPPGLTADAHLLFIFDFILSTLAGMSHVILSFAGETAERKFGYCIVLVAMTNFIGPGGALALVWAIREVWGIKLAQKLVPSKVKKTQ